MNQLFGLQHRSGSVLRKQSEKPRSPLCTRRGDSPKDIKAFQRFMCQQGGYNLSLKYITI